MRRIIITGLAVIFLVVAAMPALVVAQQTSPTLPTVSDQGSSPSAEAYKKKCKQKQHKKKGKAKKKTCKHRTD